MANSFFFVNKRFIKDPYLNHAVLTAYEDILPAESYPLYVLYIDIDPSKIDINVHPTKTEIKYQDERAIYAIVRAAVKRSLGQYNITPSLDFQQETGFSRMITHKPEGEIVAPKISYNPDFNPFQQDKTETGRISSYHEPDLTSKSHTKNWGSLYEIMETPVSSQQELHPQPQAEERIEDKVLFQVHNRFIATQIKSGLVLIDQQAAHERVLYERFLSHLDSRKGASQQSLFPQTVSLSAPDYELIKGLLPDICALGFQVREFGKNTLVVEGIPADIGQAVSETEVFENLLEGFKNNQSQLKLDKRDNLARTLARNSAIKPGTRLSALEMSSLIDELFACQMPNTSLSGKPVLLTFTIQELLQKFERS